MEGIDSTAEPLRLVLVAFLQPEAAYSTGFSHDWCTIAKIDQGLWKLGSESALGKCLSNNAWSGTDAPAVHLLYARAPQTGKCGSAHQDASARGELQCKVSTRVGALAAKHEQGLLVWPLTGSLSRLGNSTRASANMISAAWYSDCLWLSKVFNVRLIRPKRNRNAIFVQDSPQSC